MKFKFTYFLLLFCLGAVGYGFIEMLWRGYTHPSMMLAGGIAFCLLAVIEKKLKPLRFIYRCIAGGLMITAIEAIFGFIFNIWLSQNVWDYSLLPLNYKGQVCILYTVLWCFLSAPFLIITELIYMRYFSDKSVNTDDFSDNMSTKTP